MTWTAQPYRYVPDEFLPRLKPATFGTMPAGKWATRWFGRITRDRIPIVVLSKRPERGVSVHLVADRLGRWAAYEHEIKTRRRRLLGNSDYSDYLRRNFSL